MQLSRVCEATLRCLLFAIAVTQLSAITCYVSSNVPAITGQSHSQTVPDELPDLASESNPLVGRLAHRLLRLAPFSFGDFGQIWGGRCAGAEPQGLRQPSWHLTDCGTLLSS